MAVTRVPVAREILEWAVHRSAIDSDRLYRLFPAWDEWTSGEKHPTMKQIEHIARATRTPAGYFFLHEPVEIPLPIPDFRRMAVRAQTAPSPDLLEVIHTAQLRQSWYRENIRAEIQDPLPIVGSVALTDDPLQIAEKIRQLLSLSEADRLHTSTFSEMVRLLRDRIEGTGVLVFTSGIVGSDTHRALDPEEFRGFALSDDYAPVIFVNGADSKAAQIFTLIHEYVHVLLGSTGLSEVGIELSDSSTEVWCNRVAAETLVPAEELLWRYRSENVLQEEIRSLSRYFKVSTLVILRRLYDNRRLSSETYHHMYGEELDRSRHRESRPINSGGDFYNSALMRTGYKFAEAVLSSAWEGRTSFTEAMRMLGIRRMATLRTMSHRLAVYG